jgi:opacity protein-like surface antigen
MKHIILKGLVIMSLPFGFLSTVRAEDQAKEWGGFYGKLSLGYGKSDIVQETTFFNEAHLSSLGFFRYFSTSIREIAYDYRIGKNFAVGCEAGIMIVTWGRTPDASNAAYLRGEIAPQISFINGSLKLFAGAGVGFANGYGLKGMPNELTAIQDKNYTSGSAIGGFWLAEAGADYLLTPIIFIGAKYQYERTFTTHKDEVTNQSLYVQQHTFLATFGIKY